MRFLYNISTTLSGKIWCVYIFNNKYDTGKKFLSFYVPIFYFRTPSIGYDI